MAGEGKVKLSVDWDELFPGTAVTIGTTEVIVRPLALKEIVDLTKMIRPIVDAAADAGITVENLDQRSSMLIIVELLATRFPGLISDVVKIDEEDIKRLPVWVIIDLLTAAVKENIKSKEALEKNFKSLAGMAITMLTEKQASGTSPKS